MREAFIDFDTKFNLAEAEKYDFDYSEDLPREELTHEIMSRLKSMKVKHSGILVLKVQHMTNAIHFALKVKELDYCAMYDLEDVRLFTNSDGVCDMVHIIVDAESG